MKKLISAASALAMAASMVGSAVPFATGAADATKTYELRAFVDKDGKAVSTTISEDAIKAGEVKIPVGFYYVESTKDTMGIRAQWTVNSKDGDASNKNVTFEQWEPGSAYYNEKQTVSWGGKEYSTEKIIGFAGSLSENKRGVVFNHPSNDTVAFSVDTKQDSSNCKNAFGSAVWTPQADGSYEYMGAKSDDFPVTVFEVVFAQNTPAGTYTLDFIDYADDPAAPENSTCQVESTGSGTMTQGNKKLVLKSLEIKIGGSAASTPADTTKPADTTTTTAKPADTTTTTATQPTQPAGPAQTVDGQKDFIITGKDYTAKAGEKVEAEFMVSSGGHKVVLTQCELDIPEALSPDFSDPTVYCVDHDASYTALGNQWTATLKDPKTSDAVALNDEESILCIDLTVPKTAKTGDTFQYGMKFYHVVEDSFKPIEFDATIKYGTITVDNGDAPAETTTTNAPETTTTTTTAKPADSTTTTAKPTEPSTPVGNAVYGDVNCDGKVNIADVVVLNKYLNDAKSYNISAQGLINADCESVGNGVNAKDSDAIIKSIVHLVKLPC